MIQRKNKIKKDILKNLHTLLRVEKEFLMLLKVKYFQ